MRYDTVVLDGELSLEIIGFAEVDLEIEADGEFGAFTKITGGDVYTGDYVVDPKFVQQTLATRDKLMLEDVTVNEIAVASVQNPQGGQTIWIGAI